MTVSWTVLTANLLALVALAGCALVLLGVFCLLLAEGLAAVRDAWRSRGQ
ncbi:hypothetical protein [Streptomyces sp. CB03911]|nr:hypothetical protein [Streptomyces sp. CB03911]